MTRQTIKSRDFALLLSGDIIATDRLKDQTAGRSVIAADSGIRHANPLGVEVDMWVGDFDSASPRDRVEYSNVKQMQWPSEKDKTDGEIAFEIALAKKPTSILIVGAFGGRTAHASNHLLMGFNRNCDILLSSGKEEACPVESKVQPDWPQNTNFSILAIDELTGLSVTGAKWPLEQVTVPAGSGWTLSNEVNGQLSVALTSGRALLIGELAT